MFAMISKPNGYNLSLFQVIGAKISSKLSFCPSIKPSNHKSPHQAVYELME
jgi:hypothetical protein